MAKTDLGDKQICPSCGARFYDLRRRPAVCPKCTTAFDPAEEGVRVKRGRSRIAAHDPGYEDEDEELEAKAKPAAAEDDEEEEVEEAVAVDAEATDEVVLVDEEDETAAAPAEELPEGFSEEEADLGADAADDDSVPMLEEEEFPEDEIGELPAGEEDDSGR